MGMFGDDDIEVGNIEVGTLLVTIDAKHVRTMELDIPKLTPLGSEDVSIDKSILVNAAECKPSCQNKVKSKKSFSVRIGGGCFRGPWGEDEMGRVMVGAGTKIYIAIPDKNIDLMRATDWGDDW